MQGISPVAPTVGPSTSAASQHTVPPAAILVEPAAPAPIPPTEATPTPPAAAADPPAATEASALPDSGIKLAVTAAITPPAGAPNIPEKAAAPRGTDPLEARLAATREWLATEALGTYSIQLMGAEDATQLKHHLNVLAKSIEMNKIFVYRTIAKQKPSLTVLYGSFGDRREAQQALKELPASLKVYRPILRTVQGIRGEMRQHQTNEQNGSANS
jgi:septal ring-binding cell division protein DamX